MVCIINETQLIRLRHLADVFAYRHSHDNKRKCQSGSRDLAVVLDQTRSV